MHPKLRHDYIMGWSLKRKTDEPERKHDITDRIKIQYGSGWHELVQLIFKLNEQVKQKFMENFVILLHPQNTPNFAKRGCSKMA